MNHNEKYKEIIKKAWKDPNFKKELLNNPEETLKKEGIQIPGKIQVFQEEEDAHYLILPKTPTNIDRLSEEELEKASGGQTPWSGWYFFCKAP